MIESASPVTLVAESPPLDHPMGLSVAPFADTPADAFFFPSDQHMRALEFMGQALWTRARLGVVIAEHGCGKSYLIRRFIQRLDERIIAAAVQKEHIGPREFLLDILRQFGIALDDQDKTDRRRLLERFLNHQAALGRVCLLMIENAQSMHPSVLEELRCLAAIEVDGTKVLKILLLGQHSLSLVLDSQRMCELFTASVPRLTLEPLSEDQTAAYVAHRLRAAGASDPDALIPHTLMPQIFACTRGVPGRINQLCERMLGAAMEAGDRTIGARALDDAIEQLGWQDRRLPAATISGNAALQRSTQSTAKLVIAMQGMADREAALTGNRILVGRGEEADVRIDSVFVSRYHALIVRNGVEDLLLDLGSTNGIVVNSRRLLRRRLQHRDLIQVGPARLTYLNEHAAVNPQPDPGETLCFARPGGPLAAGEEDDAMPLAFGRPGAED